MASFLRSPSMVLGTPTTAMRSPFAAKNSARRAALVLESSPPTTTTASSLRRLAVSRAFSNCSGVSILVRPEPMRSKPPVLRYSSTSSAVDVHALVVDEAARAAAEAEELRGGIGRLEAVEDAGDHVVAAGSGPAREDDADPHRLADAGVVARGQGDRGQAVGAGEGRPEAVPVLGGLGRRALDRRYLVDAAAEDRGQLGRVGESRALEGGKIHELLLTRVSEGFYPKGGIGGRGRQGCDSGQDRTRELA